MSLLRWTSKSSTHLAGELVARGYDVSSRKVLRLLHQLGYSSQANAKVTEGRQHPGGRGMDSSVPWVDPSFRELVERIASRPFDFANPAAIRRIMQRAQPELFRTDEELGAGGTRLVEERSVAGPPGAPDVQLLISRPTSSRALRPALYVIHGGGMVVGTNRSFPRSLLDV
ncbi:MAG: hypothetical protein WCH93_12300, partial [Actinomycetota bacterium]